MPKGVYARPSWQERLWSYIDQSGGPDACWLWTGGRDLDGYGVFSIERKSGKAHRKAYEDAIGPIPAGMFLCHDCDNPPCCNPRHLMPGTAQQNSTAMVERGRVAHNSGEKHGAAILTAVLVREIRAKYVPHEYGYKKLAREYGVNQSHIFQIIKRKIWRDV